LVIITSSKKELKAFYEKEGERSAEQRVSEDVMVNLHLDVAKIGQSQFVLDVGCGDGHLLNEFKDRSTALGVELSRTRAERTKKKGIEVIVADAEALPLVNTVLDICFAIEVLEHVPNPPRMIQELRRVLKPDGTLIIVVPNDRNWFICRLLSGDLPEAFHKWGHLHDFSRPNKIQIISNGFRVVEVWENKHKPLILLPYIYKQFAAVKKRSSKPKGTLGVRQNRQVEAINLIITRFLEVYKKYMPLPRLTLHITIKLVKTRPILDDSIVPDF